MSAEEHPSSLPLRHPEDRILGLVVSTLGRNVIWSLSNRTAEYGVLPGAYPIIAWLTQLEEATQAELAQLIAIEQPTMAVTLRRMENGGLIKRRADPDHGRRTLIRLTPKARRLSATIRAAAFEVENIAFKGLSQKEIDNFFEAVQKMTDNLRAERYG